MDSAKPTGVPKAARLRTDHPIIPSTCGTLIGTLAIISCHEIAYGSNLDDTRYHCTNLISSILSSRHLIMEAPSTALYEQKIRKTRRRRRLLAIAALLVVVIVVIVVAVTFSSKRQHGLTATILVPLYIYPVNGSWDSLYEA